MNSLQQVQGVAKKLETMLETALGQLKTEQKKRKESENRLMELELEVVNKEHDIKLLENKVEEITRDKDEKISSLESSINFLQSVIIEKEQEILRLQELTEEIDAGENVTVGENLNQSVEKFEKTLNKLMERSQDVDFHHSEDSNESLAGVQTIPITKISNDAVSKTNVSNEEQVDADMDEAEEYVLDESMEELQNEENNIAEITEEAIDFADDIKEEPNVEPKIIPFKEPRNNKQCPVCGIVFATKSKLKQHQKDEDHATKFECELCGKHFATKGTKVAHKARIHSDIMPYKCSKCDKRFKDQGSCRRHEANDSVHIRNENIKHNPNLLCNICGKEFERNRRWCLDQHYLVHLNAKKFNCDSCSKSYRRESLLKTHMSVTHGVN